MTFLQGEKGSLTGFDKDLPFGFDRTTWILELYGDADKLARFAISCGAGHVYSFQGVIFPIDFPRTDSKEIRLVLPLLKLHRPYGSTHFGDRFISLAAPVWT